VAQPVHCRTPRASRAPRSRAGGRHLAAGLGGDRIDLRPHAPTRDWAGCGSRRPPKDGRCSAARSAAIGGMAWPCV
jgi:hypothetical protein